MDKISRRIFLHSAAAMGGAAASGENIVNRLVSYTGPPVPTRPGVWSHFATVCRECPAGCGMQLAFRDGRVTKAEGNPQHPVNAGRLCARGQSSVQGLYDPDRLKEPQCRAGNSYRTTTWKEAVQVISARVAAAPAGKVAVISGLETGTLAGVMQQFVTVFGSDRLLFYEPVHYDALIRAHGELFGKKSIPRYQLDKSDLIVSFAADFLETWVSPVEFARQFAALHAPVSGAMGRFVYIGPRFSMTAANADDFFMVPPGTERQVALAMVKALVDAGQVRGDAGMVSRAAAALGPADQSPLPHEVIARLAAAFGKARSPVALAGPSCTSSAPARDTAIAAALLNRASGSIGRNVDFATPHALSSVTRGDEFDRFLDGITNHDTVFIHKCNLAYANPAAMKAIGKAGLVVCLSTLPDETASMAHWALPVNSPLESWGDYEPWAGALGLMQPAMNPLYDTMQAGDLFLAIAKAAGRPLGTGDFHRMVKGNAQARIAFRGVASDKSWENSLRAGGIFETARAGAMSPIKVNPQPFAPEPVRAPEPKMAEAFLYPSIMLFDGRLSNRGWLQEAPDPVTYSTWGSCIEMHPAKAAALSLREGDVAELKSTAGSCRAPVRITNEVDANTAALQLGQGHMAKGLSIAYGVGANGFALLNGAGQASVFGEVSITKLGTHEAIVYGTATSRQFHREILQSMPLSKLKQMKPGDGPDLILPLPAGYRPRRDLFPPVKPHGHRWAMAVDLHKCIGCGACAVACYAENNIAVVGKKDTAMGREMAWLKVPPYKLDLPGNRIGWLPIFCQQCDAAPCETVCPVFASVHNEEGLNAQIYNRCIGTRYCSNNCPYKVRRFNWKNIAWKPPLDKQLNPEVTVRCRGIMEKCTFCVQRIRQAEYRAMVERRRVREGDIVPACVQTCSTNALLFGDLLDNRSAVYGATLADPRRYHLLEDLNTKPAITFLKRVINDQPL